MHNPKQLFVSKIAQIHDLRLGLWALRVRVLHSLRYQQTAPLTIRLPSQSSSLSLDRASFITLSG